MLAPLEIPDLLVARLSHLETRIPWTSDQGLVSVALEMPLSDIAHWAATDRQGFRFSRPVEGAARIGSGEAVVRRFTGSDRLARMRQDARRLAAHWLTLDIDETGIRPSALALFSHYPEPAPAAGGAPSSSGLLWVPSLLLQETARTAVAIFNVHLPADPAITLAGWREQLSHLLRHGQMPPRPPSHLRRLHSRPGRRQWNERVAEALRAIRDSELEKLVLTRRIEVRGERPFDPRYLEAALSDLFPDCQLVQVRVGDEHLAAATPERLVALAGRRFQVDAIAGTAARAADPESDHRLAQALAASPKQRHEHHLVVRAIREQLSPRVTRLHVPPAPQLLRLSNVQHLWSPITGRIDEDQDLFSLAAALHPTPATAGYPTEAATDWLRHRDDFARGWYTGAAGWFTPELDGELWVLLRYALLHGNTAALYAGAGITAESDPQDEWEETEAKLHGMLWALRHA